MARAKQVGKSKADELKKVLNEVARESPDSSQIQSNNHKFKKLNATTNTAQQLADKSALLHAQTCHSPLKPSQRPVLSQREEKLL